MAANIVIEIMPKPFRHPEGIKALDGHGKERIVMIDCFQAVIRNGKSELGITPKRLETFAEMGCDPIILAECKAKMEEAEALTRKAHPGIDFEGTSKASAKAVSSVSYAELKARAAKAGVTVDPPVPGKRLPRS